MNLKRLYIVLLTAISCTTQISALPFTKNHKDSSLPSTNSKVKVYKEGDDMELECEASGTFQPSFHWLFNGKYLEQGPLDTAAKNLMSSTIAHEKIAVKATLLIKNVNPEYAGKYTCIADSLTKRVIDSYTVIVEKKSDKKPAEKSKESDEHDLRIYEWTDELLQEEGSPMYAVCRATQGITKPAPTIRWTIGNKDIPTSDNVKIHTNGDLEVSKVTLDYHWWEGELTCHATSEDGKYVVSKGTWVYISPLEDPGDKMPKEITN